MPADKTDILEDEADAILDEESLDDTELDDEGIVDADGDVSIVSLDELAEEDDADDVIMEDDDNPFQESDEILPNEREERELYLHPSRERDADA